MTVFRIMEDATELIDLNDGSTTFFMNHTPVRSGGGFRFYVNATTIAQVQAVTQAVERAFTLADRRVDTRTGPKIRLELRLPTDTVTWRTLILKGATVTYDESTVSNDLARGKVICTLTLVREDWWEGPLTTLPLSNGNGTDVTTGLEVRNHDDAGAGDDNWCTYDGADVDGDMPTPIKLTVTNTFASAARMSHLWYGHNNRYSQNSYVLEGEDASYPVNLGSDATCSGGQYNTTVSVSQSKIRAMEWELDQAMMSKMTGSFFRPIVRLAGGTTYSGWASISIYYALSFLWESKLIRIGGYWWYDFGPMRIPPHILNEADVYPLVLKLNMKFDSSTHTQNVDFVNLLPCDGIRHLSPDGYGCDETVSLIDDGIDDLLYTYGWTGYGKVANYVGEGKRPELIPGESGGFQFMMTGTTGDIFIDRTIDVKVEFRPRKRTIV